MTPNRVPTGNACGNGSTPTTGVVYAKQPLGGPEAALDQLRRHTQRAAIANELIVDIESNDVLFRVRADPARDK